MTITLSIPDEISADLNAGFQNVGRTALEALAAKAYVSDVISLLQVRRLLGLQSRWEAEAVLSSHGAWPGHTLEEIMMDVETASSMRTTVK
jgi:hypothetical protein